MNETIKLCLVVLLGAIGAAIPVTAFYFGWSWAMSQVPHGEYSGLIKVGVSFLMFAIGGGLTFALALLGGTLALAAALRLRNRG